MDGLLLTDKPKGWTSFDVVAKVRSLAKQTVNKKVKVGHAGTLDPLATGLLIILIGSYCKKASEYSKLDKVYKVELMLGLTSETDDEEGQKTTVSDVKPTLKQVSLIVNSFVGEILQTPPIYSAIKIDGQRAYKKARKKEQFEIKPRKVSVYWIKDLQYSYPIVSFNICVSSGTYIRSLARDIGENLGVGAYMSNLRRVKIGEYSLIDAQKPTHPNLIQKIID